MFSRNLSYIIFAGIFFLFWFLFKVGGMPHIGRALSSTSIDVGVTMLTMLVTVELLLPKYIYTNRYIAFFILFLLLVFASGSIIILAQLRLQGSSLASYQENVAKSKLHFFYWFWADLIFGSYLLVFFTSATGASIRFAFDRLKAVNTVNELEKEKKTAELESLRDQINPHFLFNALNTIYYKIDRTNADARETLQIFSGMLRYQLYESNMEFIGIEKELTFLKSYIELQKTRLNPGCEVIYKGFDTVKEFSISPFLLMPLIENCFKHLSNYSDKKNRIYIEVKMESNSFLLHTYNSKEPANTHSQTGIGLENVKKRLELLYENRHLLNTVSAESSFELNLKLQLQ